MSVLARCAPALTEMFSMTAPHVRGRRGDRSAKTHRTHHSMHTFPDGHQDFLAARRCVLAGGLNCTSLNVHLPRAACHNASRWPNRQRDSSGGPQKHKISAVRCVVRAAGQIRKSVLSRMSPAVTSRLHTNPDKDPVAYQALRCLTWHRMSNALAPQHECKLGQVASAACLSL